MPDFLGEYINELQKKSERIKMNFEKSEANNELERVFSKYWINSELINAKPDFSVLAIDSSSTKFTTSNGGIFYVIRALGLSRDSKYRKIWVDLDYSEEPHYDSYILSRMMEWLEHSIAIEAINNGFEGLILVDGSIYGRIAHIPIEINFVNNRAFMIKYFEAIITLFELCERKKVPLIGISKESRTSFFREFLIKEILNEMEKDGRIKDAGKLLSLALDDKRKAIEEAEKLQDETIIKLIEELIHRRPDFQLILNCANSAGYTTPLLLGASLRWRREYDRIARDPEEFVISRFPLSSRKEEFVRRASKIVREILNLPAIVSFHLLPSKNDTPMRIDIPAWFFGIKEKISEVGWPEAVNVELGEILRLISAGYCGLDNYNIWLSAVDFEVRLRREIFENLYLPKFEEIVGRFATPRGYRRVRFP